jgi:hypothetical protein
MNGHRYRSYRHAIDLIDALGAGRLPESAGAALRDLAEQQLLSRDTAESDIRDGRRAAQLAVRELADQGCCPPARPTRSNAL